MYVWYVFKYFQEIPHFDRCYRGSVKVLIGAVEVFLQIKMNQVLFADEYLGMTVYIGSGPREGGLLQPLETLYRCLSNYQKALKD